MDDSCRIRAARSADLGAVAAIEAAVFPDPWSAALFRGHLDGPFLVAETAGAGIVGYVVARVVEDEAEVLNVAVAPPARGRGIGRALMTDVLRLLAARGVRASFLEVRASNRAAQRLYRAMGFVEVGRRRDYYRSPREDALILVRTEATPAGEADALP